MAPTCDTCKTKLGDMPYRVVVLKDKDGEPVVVYFHYFFPCWDIDLLSQKYPDCKIIDAGFNVEAQSVQKSINEIKNLKHNEDFWK